jgi:hypothetical protein
MPKLTKRIVDAAECRATEYFIWDQDIPCFGLRVMWPQKLRRAVSGRKTTAAYQPRPEYRSDLRAGSHPCDHRGCRGAERRRSGGRA